MELYLYYKSNGKEVRIRSFHGFKSLFWWCDRYCQCKSGHYYYEGNQVLFGYKKARKGKCK